MRATNGWAGLLVLVLAAAGQGCTHGEAAEGAAAGQAGSEATGDEAVAAAEAQARAEPSQANGRKVADALMAQWQRHNPDRDWVAEEHDKHVIVPPADNGDLVGKGQGSTYGQITEQDVKTWAREVQKEVAMGSRIFHSAELLSSPIAVSCDMCHPDASNTHPETYPKFQVQMGRVAHLRDMINWCVEHPVRAEPLDPDGPEMRALEAYILAQRKGTELNYGRR